LYGRAVPLLRLTDHGKETTASLASVVDVRERDLADYTIAERGHFALVSAYAMVERAGFPLDDVLPLVKTSTEGAARIFDDLQITSREAILYSPYQQAPQAVLAEVDRLHG
jgi:hypothetical protein